MNSNIVMTKASIPSPLVAQISPNPQVVRVVMTKYTDAQYYFAQSFVVIPRLAIHDLSKSL